MSIQLIVVILYVIGMLGVGYFTNKKLVRSSEDYMLAGRALPAFMVAVSLSANNIGGGSSTGVASRAFGDWGISAGWYVLAAAIGIIPIALFAPYLRKTLAYTIPEVIGKRFGTPSHIITSAVNIIALFCLTASQILASGTVISVLVGLEIHMAIVLAGLITIVYTIMGGLWADAFTDLFQWAILFFGLLIAVPFVISGAGGWGEVVSHVPAERMSFTALGWITIISLTLNYFITFLSGPEMVSRIYAAKDEREGTKAVMLSAVMMGLYAFIPAVIGIVAYAKFPDINPNSALVTVVFELAPGVISGLVCAAILAATMSSADSDMLCASTIFMRDIYMKYVNHEVDDKRVIMLTRVCNAVIGLLAMFIALFQINIITLNVFAFMLRAAGPFAAFALGLLWKEASLNSGIVSIIAGSAAGIYWQIIGEPFGILAVIFGSSVSMVAFIVTTLVERKMGRPAAPYIF